MYTRNFDGVCLVSSDSDFTRLAQRLREEGLTVYGFGERKTPDAFVQACDKFIYTEVLRPEAEAERSPEVAASDARGGTQRATKKAAGGAEKNAALAAASGASSSASASDASTTASSSSAGTASVSNAVSASSASPRSSGPLPLPLAFIRQAIEEASDEQGWAHLGAVGTYLNKVRPDFDPRLYGQKKLSDLLRQQPRHFKVEERSAPNSAGRSLYVRTTDPA